MCSLHPRIAKKFGAGFEEIRGQIQLEATDDAVIRLKTLKQKAGDECLMLTGCAFAERYLKILQAPTPPKRNLPLLQQHVDELIKAFH